MAHYRVGTSGVGGDGRALAFCIQGEEVDRAEGEDVKVGGAVGGSVNWLVGRLGSPEGPISWSSDKDL